MGQKNVEKGGKKECQFSKIFIFFLPLILFKVVKPAKWHHFLLKSMTQYLYFSKQVLYFWHFLGRNIKRTPQKNYS